MKFRTGFVSNSSSSSFCVFGYQIPFEDVKEFANNTKNEYLELKAKDQDLYDPSTKKFDYSSTLLLLDKKFSKSNRDIDITIDWDNEVCYYGRAPQSLKDNETGKDFRESIKCILKRYLLNWTHQIQDGILEKLLVRTFVG